MWKVLESRKIIVNELKNSSRDFNFKSEIKIFGKRRKVLKKGYYIFLCIMYLLSPFLFNVYNCLLNQVFVITLYFNNCQGNIPIAKEREETQMPGTDIMRISWKSSLNFPRPQKIFSIIISLDSVCEWVPGL